MPTNGNTPERKYRAKANYKDRLKREAAKRQNGLCAYCSKPLPEDPKKYNLGHGTVTKAAVTLGKATREDGYLLNHDGTLSDNAIAIHNSRDLGECNQSQGTASIEETVGNPIRHSNYRILRMLVDERTRVQKARIAWFNRALSADMLDTEDVYEVAEQFTDAYADTEKRATKMLTAEVKKLVELDPVLYATMQVPGIGPVLAARILADIDFARAEHSSSLHRFAGYGVGGDGKRDKSVEGQPSVMNKRLKIAMRHAVESFIKLGPDRSPYARKYAIRKTFTENDAVWGLQKKGHRHNDAIGVTAKMFLSHLWEVGRRINGLSIEGPYVTMLPGKHDYISPQQYGWPDLEDVMDRFSNGNMGPKLTDDQIITGDLDEIAKQPDEET